VTDLTERITEALNGTTPGPWEFDGAEVYSSAEGRWVAESLHVGYPDESNANARLIAAAPALLREAAEQLAAKDAEIKRLRARHRPDCLTLVGAADVREHCDCRTLALIAGDRPVPAPAPASWVCELDHESLPFRYCATKGCTWTDGAS
jgi:hypothetical protein